MAMQKENLYKFQIPRQQVEDIEAHCRKIHADAVVDSFVMFFTVPLKLICRLISARKSKHIEKIQAA